MGNAGLGETPFRASIALEEGLLTPHALYRDFARVYRDVYVSKGIDLDIRSRAKAAWILSRGRAVLGGYSAATFHNTKWIADDQLPELIWPHHGHRHPQILIRTDKVPEEEIMTVAGMRLTTPVRTAMDLGCRLKTDDAIVVLDALCAATALGKEDISLLIDSYSGARGIVNLRRILEFVDAGAESPQETHTRLMLIRAGLPAPSTQIQVRDQFGAIFARCDMGWEKWKVSVEYDGKQHWDNAAQRAGDIDRQNLLENWAGELFE